MADKNTVKDYVKKICVLESKIQKEKDKNNKKLYLKEMQNLMDTLLKEEGIAFAFEVISSVENILKNQLN